MHMERTGPGTAPGGAEELGVGRLAGAARPGDGPAGPGRAQGPRGIGVGGGQAELAGLFMI